MLQSGFRLPVFIIGSWIILLIVFVFNPLSGKAAEKSTVTTTSGLQYVDLALGTGREAHAGETAIVHYTGTLTDGTKFDSSKDRNSPFSFRLGAGSVIKGWDEGVEGMNIGGIRKLVIPPQLGYGSRGAGSAVPPNATLIFEVELLDLR
ncbi:MAG: FKBP-type peptidyl-prolyl cis-trans isomerase [Nitrospirales bacterium]|nr:FKBP-type peptidyl-prolyl cis-trans isomerase [Nitrospirales bacterium]MBA3966117.1 FKBP-type peptidyl-prolyl cis-trans isomerase [Nitrospirales bacterium]